MGFDFIVIAPLLPSHCGFSFVWMWGIFFGEFQCLPVDDCSSWLVVAQGFSVGHRQAGIGVTSRFLALLSGD